MSEKFSRVIEAVLIFGTYKRPDIALKSLESLSRVGSCQNWRLVVADASDKPLLAEDCERLGYDYIWTPGDVSMAASRDLAFAYAKMKYVAEWVLFLEDDLVYEEHWYETLINFAGRTYGKLSPFGLAYGVFSASPGVKRDETVVFDEENDCFAQFFGPRADQRLYKMSHYDSVVKHWDPDVLGISSSQTGAQIQRNTLRGFCSASIAHLNLCSFVEGEVSTWQGIRDIGPAAFDKRLGGYKSIVGRVKELSKEGPIDNVVSNIRPQNEYVMTELKFDEKFGWRNRLRKLFGR